MTHPIALAGALLLSTLPQLPAAELVANGEPASKLVVSEGWRPVGGFLQSTGVSHLTPQAGIGDGDFRITARMRLDKLERSACGLVLGNSFFGFAGAHGKMFITGKLFDGARGLPIGEPKDHLTNGRQFDFEVVRQGGRIQFAIDGKVVLERKFTTNVIGRFGFAPSRAVMAIRDLRVAGNLHARYVNYIPPEEAYRTRTVPGVDKVILLPPAPGNPRNSEGDFVRLKDGRILFTYTHFTGGGSDHAAAHLAGRFSADGGLTWTKEDVTILPNEGGYNVMSVSLLRLADGRLALFYLRKNSLSDCRPLLRISRDEAKTWSEPTEVIKGPIGYYVMNNDRVIQTKTGRLICPVALHNMPDYEQPDWHGKLMCYLSDDGGQTWRRSESQMKGVKPDGRRITFQEPGVVELRDGRLMMFIRTREGSQYLSWSEDGGDTWTNPVASDIKSPTSPATIERIPGTGKLLMAWNDHSLIAPELRGKRTPLAVAVSKDDGKTWSPRRLLEDDPNGWYCYTAMYFAGDRVLLGHCAEDRRKGGLNTTQITSFKLDWLDH